MFSLDVHASPYHFHLHFTTVWGRAVPNFTLPRNQRLRMRFLISYQLKIRQIYWLRRTSCALPRTTNGVTTFKLPRLTLRRFQTTYSKGGRTTHSPTWNCCAAASSSRWNMICVRMVEGGWTGPCERDCPPELRKQERSSIA